MVTVIVESTGGSRSPLQSPTRQPRTRSIPRRMTIANDFRQYELGVLAVTQLSYIPVAATMLSTSFYEPSQDFCSHLSEVNGTSSLYDTLLGDTTEFRSLLLERDEVCGGSPLVALLSTSLMGGALLGAFVAGWMADSYGRRPVVKGCLLLICLGNLLFSLFASLSWPLAAMLLFILGMACGGYMVTNLVLLIECLETSRSRLLAVSLNGWSVSMVVVAVLASCTRHWLTYHLITAASAVVAAVACHFLTVESCRWLAGVHRLTEAHLAATKVARKNAYKISPDACWWELVGFSMPPSSVKDCTGEVKLEEVRRYGYADLFTVPSVYWPLCALCYCFVASSIVSFGFYFNVDALPGDRYSNMAIMGTSKFVMGLIPFAVSSWFGRRPIVLLSVGVACLAAWSICISQLSGSLEGGHWSLVVLSLLVASSLDPTWKINHLYSAELFPTVVRNMARGICNVGARLGSVAAPTIVHLRAIHYLIPYVVFAVLLSVQFVVVAGFLPETKDRPLPDEFPDQNASPVDVECVEVGTKSSE